MIPVGIHDNLRVHKATRNDRGSLVIGYKQEVGGEQDLLAIINSASDSTSVDGKDNDFLIYSLDTTDRQGNQFTPEQIVKNITELKDMLNHILLNYMTSDKIAWEVFNGCGITPENIKEKVVQQSVLDQVYKNIVDQFIGMITPHLTNTTKLFRCIFVRQSKAKHYASLRRRYLTEQPFMEPMSVPKEQSRLKFTEWEKTNGFNSGDKATGADVPNAGETTTADQLFNLQPR
jgi:hypothetical protein